jgi:hypothetical protein
MTRRFHRLGMVGAILVAALSLQPGGAADAATTGPTLLGEHCVALRLVSGDLVRACAAVADNGTTGAFAVPISSYGTVGIYTHDSEGDIVVVTGYYAVYGSTLTLYANHQLYNSIPDTFSPPFYAPDYLTMMGYQMSVPSGYVETESQVEVFSPAGNTALTVWSYPVPTSSL